VNVKPGDLAIVVRDEFEQNIGRIVKVLCESDCDVGAWLCRAVGAPMLIMSRRTEVAYFDHEGDAYDSDLRPISGVPVDDEVTEDLKEPA
jgi:hypothetical protein